MWRRTISGQSDVLHGKSRIFISGMGAAYILILHLELWSKQEQTHFVLFFLLNNLYNKVLVLLQTRKYSGKCIFAE